jgi:hypothetical protein
MIVRIIPVREKVPLALTPSPSSMRERGAGGDSKCDRNQGWKLQRGKPTRNPILMVDCMFEGEQTSFEDDRYA